MSVWKFVYFPNKAGKYVITLETRNNPQYFLCRRCFLRELERLGEFEPFEEVVTLTEPTEIMTYEQARNYPLTEEQQILCEYCFLDENGSAPDVPYIAERVVEGFAFCGFEIADEWEISALTNCGFDYDKAFTKADLNKWGLIEDYQKARTVLSRMFKEYGDDPDANDWMLFAVWRRICEM
ncbi:MAG: hypothetical protein K2N06_09635 [Oscillospiraceae bacterium]|nr:hypothetical protein [Oscillospiraceae bacterium]